MPMPDVLPHERPAAAPTTSQTPVAVQSGSRWVPSTLTGSRVVSVGGSKFTIPRSAQVKTSKRSATTWVRTEDGLTFILSELGLLDQTDAERRSTRWDLL